MSYLGLEPSTSNFVVDNFDGDGATVVFNLSVAPASKNAIAIHIDGVHQSINTYGVVGTTLTFTGAPPIGIDNIEVTHLGLKVEVTQPSDNSVGQAQIETAVFNELKTGRKNKIINGAFDIWQRGVSFTIDGSYTADRWFGHINLDSGSGSVAISRQEFTLGQTDVPGNPKYYGEVSGTSHTPGANGWTANAHRIENVKSLSNIEVTLSFWARSAESHSLAAALRQNFGTGGSPSTPASVGIGNFSVSTSWTKQEITFTVPSISGKTLGTDGNDYLEILLFSTVKGSNASFFGVNAIGDLNNDTIDIANVQLELGNIATDFEQLQIGDVLAQCQRYFYKVGDDTNSIVGSGLSVSTVLASIFVPLPVTMRATPSLVSANITTMTTQDAASGVVITSLGLSSLTSLTGASLLAGRAGYTIGNGCTLSLSGTAGELVGFDAEL